jgi:WD40 repeat protein
MSDGWNDCCSFRGARIMRRSACTNRGPNSERLGPAPVPVSASEVSPVPVDKPVPAKRDFAVRLFGYDVFISFALGSPPRGTLSYASDLARRLRERDFTVYFSEDEAPPGEHLDHALRRALRGSRILVIIANRGTLAEPRWVRTEVESFRSLKPERPIIPINIGGALHDPELRAATAQWLPVQDTIWLDEAEEAAETGIASAAVVERLALAPQRIRSNVKWRWLVGAVGATLLALVVAFAVAAKVARDNARTALAGELAARATVALTEDPDRALQEALASLDVMITAEGERVLRLAVQQSSAITVFDGDCRAQSADFGPGGRYVMTRCTDGSARVWDPVTAQPVLSLAGTEEDPVIAEWAADESAVYVADAEGNLRVLALPDARESMRLPANGALVSGIIVNPLAHQLIVWREGDGLRAYAAADLAQQWHNPAPASGVRWVRASHDGTELAVLWPDPEHDGLGSVRYFDSRDGQLVVGLGGQPAIYARGSIFDPEGRRMLRLGDDEISEHWNAVTWDLRAGTQAATLNRPAGRFWAGAIDEEGTAYIGYWGNVVQVWVGGRGEGELLQPWVELSGHSDRVIDIDVRVRDGERYVLTASADGTARLWRPTPRDGSSLSDRSELRVLRGHRGAVTMARFSPDGQRAVTVGSDGTARVWRLAPNHLGPAEQNVLLHQAANADGQVVRVVPVDAAWQQYVLHQVQRVQLVDGEMGSVCEVDTAPFDLGLPTIHVDGAGRRLMLVHEQGGRAVLLDLPSCQERHRVPLPGDRPPIEVSFNAGATAALFRFDAYHVVDLDTGRELGVLRGAQHIFEPAAFVGRARAVVALDAWGKHLVKWSGPPYGDGEPFELPFAVEDFVVSPDRQLLAVRSGAGETAVVHATTGEIVHRWAVRASGLAFSADGSRLAATDLDGVASVWSLRDGRLLMELQLPSPFDGHPLKFSSDGQRLFGSAGVWAVPSGQRLDVPTPDFTPWIDGIWFRRETWQRLETTHSVHRCLTCAPLDSLATAARQRVARRAR